MKSFRQIGNMRDEATCLSSGSRLVRHMLIKTLQRHVPDTLEAWLINKSADFSI
jgi:hypothetical protein